MEELTLFLNEEILNQNYLIDCDLGDTIFIDQIDSDHHLHLTTSWGDDLGILPKTVQSEIQNAYDMGIGINAKIATIDGDNGNQSLNLEIYLNSQLDDSGRIVSIH